MKSTVRLLSVILLLATAAFATSICDGSVFDGANVLGSKMSQVASAAQAMDAQGADTHIITVKMGNFPNLDALAMGAVKNCPSWQSPNGGVKTNLVIIAVAPAERKMGIYAGKGWDAAFSSAQMAKYRTNYMGPYFKSADWAGGLISGANQMTARLAAYKSEANAPVTNTTVNEASPPTDLKGLWIFLLVVAGLGGVVIIFVILSSIKRTKEQKAEAQQNAIAAKAECAKNISIVNDALASYNGNFDGSPGAKSADQIFSRVSATFSDLQNSVTYDPTDNSLSLGQYSSIATQYVGLTNQLFYAKKYLRNPKKDTFWSKPENAPEESAPPVDSSSVPAGVGVTHHHHHYDSSPAPVVIQPASGSDLLTGVLIGEELNRPSSHEDSTPSYSEPEPEPPFTPSSSSSSFGSSSSEEEDKPSFSDSSSGSSFSDDSSSSSSFSDSSSDFGSSSSSDFGSSSGGDSF